MIPTLKKVPFAADRQEIFRLIDRDESRYRAMDYWIPGHEANRLREGGRDPIGGPIDVFRCRIPVAGFFGNLPGDPNLSGSDFEAYRERARAVPGRADGAMEVPSNWGPTFGQVSEAADFFEERPACLRRISKMGNALPRPGILGTPGPKGGRGIDA